MKKNIPNLSLFELVEESIEKGLEVKLRIRGNSMSPLLIDGVDVVTLKPFLPEKLVKGDIIFFRYKEGYILHRIVEIDNNKIVTKGDAMDKKEVIKISDIIAIAQIPKKGYLLSAGRKLKILLIRIKNFNN